MEQLQEDAQNTNNNFVFMGIHLPRIQPCSISGCINALLTTGSFPLPFSPSFQL